MYMMRVAFVGQQVWRQIVTPGHELSKLELGKWQGGAFSPGMLGILCLVEQSDLSHYGPKLAQAWKCITHICCYWCESHLLRKGWENSISPFE